MAQISMIGCKSISNRSPITVFQIIGDACFCRSPITPSLIFKLPYGPHFVNDLSLSLSLRTVARWSVEVVWWWRSDPVFGGGGGGTGPGSGDVGGVGWEGGWLKYGGRSNSPSILGELG